MSNSLLIENKLLLEVFTQQAPPAMSRYQNVQQLDLKQVDKIDSAGVAYLVQIKTHYPSILLCNASKKLRILAELYGVESLFEK